MLAVKLRTAGVSERLFLVRTEAAATPGSRTAVGRRDRNGKLFTASTCCPTILSGMHDASTTLVRQSYLYYALGRGCV